MSRRELPLLDPQLADLVAQLAEAQAELLGGTGAVPAGGFQRVDDGLAFQGLHAGFQGLAVVGCRGAVRPGLRRGRG